MVARESLRLGQRVWYGDERVPAVVDGITVTVIGLRLESGGYVIAAVEDVYGAEGD